MLALLLITGFLGITLAMDTDSSTEDSEADDVSTDLPEEESQDTASGETITTILDAGADDFEGSSANDRIAGNATANDLLGRGGNDFIQGFAGDDSIDAGTGSDTVFAGEGNDTAVGGDGDDRVFLGDGDDTYLVEDDTNFDRGDDLIRGGSGDDGILDTRGSDTIYGDQGDDFLAAFGTTNTPDPSDTLYGGSGDDTLIGDNGDLLFGGTGADFFAVVQPPNTETEAIIIDDFSVNEDALTLFVPQANDSFEDVDFRFDSQQNAVRAFWRGDEVAILNGLTSADIGNINVSIIDAADLARAGYG